MNKKNLPKAILHTADSMRQAAATLTKTERVDDLLLPEIFAPSAATPAQDPFDEPTPSQCPPADTTPSLAGHSIGAAARRRRAEAIVERYANYSALGGFIPVPLMNVASVTAIIVRMVKALSDVYDVPFEAERARGIVLGLIGGLTPTAASALTISSLLFVVPGVNLLGIATSSISASACARKIGGMFIRHFESGASLLARPVGKTGK